MSFFKDEEVPRAEVTDLITLSNLNQFTMMETIRMRFANNLIYTWTGTILVSVNPFVLLPIYTPDIVQRYLRDSLKEPPHIFAVADRCFRDMVMQNKNQCVLISGESGAGKTEATKLILQFLAAITHKHSQIEQQILEVNPILEAFGNAKTIRNNNSSRFGRFTEIQFSHQNDGIVGATITDYLLEKSRVVWQAPNERNYHIFYQLVAGAYPEEKTDFKLTEARDYKYLNQSGCIEVEGVDDSADFDQMRVAMDSLLISADVQRTIFGVLAAILHLGNVEFTGKDETQVAPKSQDTMAVVARLLGVEAPKLIKNLTTRDLVVRGQTTVVPLKIAEAIDGKDALAKALYSNLFSWLVRTINKTLSPKKGAARLQIGILDIFGFEHFKVNSFEQLMINFTNEKLQQQFNNFIFKLEQEEYEKEKINWSVIQFVDNQDVLDLIEKRPLGILSILDEECKFPKATDKTFLEKLHANHAKNPRYLKPKVARDEFGVVHFAGDVMYDVKNFLEKNKDTLTEGIRALLQAAKVDVIREIFADAPGTESAGDKTKTRPTVGSHFKNQLQTLMNTLSACSPHYVRCIKPNFDKLPLTFDVELVTAQLRYAGMLETIRIRRLGYPQRFPWKDFHFRYKCLLEGDLRTEDYRKDINNVFAKVLKSEVNSWQIGTTKVFLKDHHKTQLESLRNGKLAKSITVIQKTWRMWVHRRKYLAIRRAALRVQTSFRMYRDRYRFVRKRKSAAKIQATYKMWKLRRHFLNMRVKVMAIQSIIRSSYLRKKFLEYMRVCVTLQTAIRRVVYRIWFINMKRAHKVCMTPIRGFLGRQLYNRMIEIKLNLDAEAREKRRQEELDRRERQRLMIEERRKAQADQNKAAGIVEGVAPADGTTPPEEHRLDRPFNDPRIREEYQFLFRLLDQIDEFNEGPRFMIRERLDKLVAEDKDMVGKVRVIAAAGARVGVPGAEGSAGGGFPFPFPMSPEMMMMMGSMGGGMDKIVEKRIYISVGADGKETILREETKDGGFVPGKAPKMGWENERVLYKPVTEVKILGHLTPEHLKKWWPKDFGTEEEDSKDKDKKRGSFLAKPQPAPSPSKGKTTKSFLPYTLRPQSGKKEDTANPGEVRFPEYPLFFTVPTQLIDPTRQLTKKTSEIINTGNPNDHPLAWIKFVETFFKNPDNQDPNELGSFTARQLKSPLLECPEDKVKVALDVWKEINDYLNPKKELPEQNRLLQSIVRAGIEHPQLRNEIYAQLIKQMNKNDQEESIRKGWELLYFITAAFGPDGDCMKHVKHWLQTQVSVGVQPTIPSSQHPGATQFPEYTHLCIDNFRKFQFKQEGEEVGRALPPSLIEIHTFREKLGALGVVVRVVGGGEHKIPLDGTTTAREVVIQILKKLAGTEVNAVNLRKISKQYSIYEVVNNNRRVVPRDLAVADVINRWEIHGQKMAKIGVSVSFGFLFRKRLNVIETLDRASMFETALEFQQATNEIIEGNTLVPEKEAIKLAALQYTLHPVPAKTAAQLYIPKPLQDNHNSKVWHEMISDKSKTLHFKANTSEEVDEIKRTYLKYARRLPAYGAEIFKIQNRGKLALPGEMELAINARGIHLLEIVSKDVLKSFEWGIFEKWAYEAETKQVSWIVKCSAPHIKFEFETLQGDQIIQLLDDYDDILREESMYAVAVVDHAGDERQISFNKDDILIIKTRNSEKWFTGKAHGKYGLFPSEKVNVIFKGEVPVKNPSTNFKHLKDLVQLELGLFKIVSPEMPHVDESSHNLNVYADNYFRRAATRDVRLIFTKDPIKSSLIELPFLEKEAPKTFEMIMKYMGDMATTTDADTLGSDILSKMQIALELRDEIYCQICKQITKNPRRSSTQKGMELLGACILGLPPSPQLAPHIMGHLQLFKAEDRETRNVANWLVYQLHKISTGKGASPSGDGETTSKLINVRVQLGYGPSVQVMLDPKESAKEMFKAVVHRIHLRNTGNYYLYLVNGQAERRLQDTENLQGLMSMSDGNIPDLRLKRITLSYKATSSVVKLDLLFYQALNNVVQGKHPLTVDEAVLLAGYQIHALYGDYDPSSPAANKQTIANFIAPFYQNESGIIDKVNKAHAKVFGQSASEAKARYLELVSEWPLSSSSLFVVEQKKKPQHVVLAINEDTVLLLAPPKMDVIHRWAHSEIVSWSAAPGAFRLNTGSMLKPVVFSFQTAQGEELSDMMNYWRNAPKPDAKKEAPRASAVGSSSSRSKDSRQSTRRDSRSIGRDDRSSTASSSSSRTSTLRERSGSRGGDSDRDEKKSKIGSLRTSKIGKAVQLEVNAGRERSASVSGSSGPSGSSPVVQLTKSRSSENIKP